MSKPRPLYSEQMPILKSRIGLPLNVNSRSEFGILLAPKANANSPHSNKDILTFSKTTRPSNVRPLTQTRKPLRWKLRSLKRNKQNQNDSVLNSANKSSCCENKTSKSNAQSGNGKPKIYNQKGKRRFFWNGHNANFSLENKKIDALQPMNPYIDGKCIIRFLSGWIQASY